MRPTLRRQLLVSGACACYLMLGSCAEPPKYSEGYKDTEAGNGSDSATPGGDTTSPDPNGNGLATNPPDTNPPAPPPPPPAPPPGAKLATGKVDLSFTVVAPNPGGRYTPSHVQTIFVTDMNNKLIRTISASPGNPAPAGQHLRRWRSLTNNTTDGISGATLRAYGAPAAPISWDLKDRGGNVVAEGSYKIWFELAEANTTGTIAAGGSISTAAPINGIDTVAGYHAFSTVVTIGSAASMQTATDSVFSNLTVKHTP